MTHKEFQQTNKQKNPLHVGKDILRPLSLNSDS